jgi:hypothetical protein
MCDTIYELVRIKRELEHIVKENKNENVHLRNAVLSIEKYLAEICQHQKVRDYIDIHPETSVPIEYCSICLTTF